jgi:glutathione S-transferase
MDGLVANPAFQTYALCSAILAVKMLLTGNYTTLARMRNKAYINEEDARTFGGTAAGQQEHPAVAHALRIQRNDLENIPLFFVIGLIYVLQGASPFATAAYCWTFTIARLVHWVAYLNHLQPWRAISYFVGYLCILGMAVQIAL